jgi:hypothetical protein
MARTRAGWTLGSRNHLAPLALSGPSLYEHTVTAAQAFAIDRIINLWPGYLRRSYSE